LITKNGSLALTPEHLVCINKDEFVYAKNVKVGNCLLRIDINLSFNEEVIKIDYLYDNEIYAPLTVEGTLIVNGFLTSCYANFPSHTFAHLSMLPLILCSKDKTDYYFDKKIHPYCEMLMNIKNYLTLIYEGMISIIT